ncbi:MAG: ADP-ribosylglycohydrolase family protein [Microcoleus sp. PH2017_40_RAT_O_B]|jgi:ADP-ribosylglycohydrolase|uniref:ADP-ribosylglycohydrolase family protein n=1 Tax=Microcoleus sp. PH2017_40_RAT_O_B TaxID=2798850 RepID=UPI001DD36780|nr:ADP-ribosylglycohydrolase family protein [Microcoleus sp. PH2017_40_RAT_O_B]MCC3571804.1 ADP-ribosylglycohydrolase family protein [Microcoleus sp. PH2017_34_RAT_O_A]MCC3609431.1 ADP-ribosylglycohydrolase family protein [Microcoleus sp. PH2017_40_RAT_O_B]
MRHSLLSKFQGTILGAVLGDSIGLQYQRQLAGILPQTEDLQPILQLTKHQQFTLNGAILALNSPNTKILRGKYSECGKLAVACAQSLIRCNGLDLKDWRDTWEVLAKSEIYHSPNTEFQSLLNPCEAAVAALPCVMFFHENKAKLREKIMLATDVLPNENKAQLQTAVLAIGYAIARSLKQRLDPGTAIEQTIAYLNIDTALTELLRQVQILLEQGADLETATTHLCKSATALRGKPEEGEKQSETHSNVNPGNFIPIALAFYCFLSTPEDLRLSVVRAARSGIAGQLTCALTGALSGAYNGAAAIPVEWRQVLSAVESQPLVEGREPSLWGTGSDAKILELASNLFAVWAGVYNPSAGPDSAALARAVAAPYVIRPRKI